MRRRRVPLAWYNLVSDRRRLLIAATGIGFAVLLMCAQVGFYFALLDSTVELLERCNADIFIKSTNRYSLVNREGFSIRRLRQAAACEGVTVTYPLYLESTLAVWRNVDDGLPRWIRVVGFDPKQPVLLLPEVTESRQRLLSPYTAMSDRKSKTIYGPIDEGTISDLSGQRVKIVGQFSLATDFMNDGNLIMSDRNFQRYFPMRGGGGSTLNDVDLGLVKIALGQDPTQVSQQLQAILPRDVQVLTKAAMIREERQFWQRSTPVGVVFGMGTVMGFIVGVIICYQVLFSQLADFMPEFATLKAMGYPFRYFLGVVIQQALLLAMLGFVPGLIASALLYQGIGAWTGLLMRLTLGRSLVVLLLTVSMCVASGLLAIRKVRSADPAELF